MAVKTFTDEQVQALNENPYVIQATNRRISYTTDFKKLFVEKYAEGLTPREIFYQAGFDVMALGNKRIERVSDRWRQMNNEGRFGEEAQYVEVHKNKARGREPLRDTIQRQSDEISKLENEITKLKAELTALRG